MSILEGVLRLRNRVIQSAKNDGVTVSIHPMSWSSCPFCSQQVLSTELERHANNHFEDEDLAKDFQLAKHYHDEDIPFDLPHHISVPMQVKPKNDYELKHGCSSIMVMLKDCLECDNGTNTSILCGHVDHFQSVEFEDIGWGCGWRNIQMLTSHLVVQRQEAKEILFGGDGLVPDILSLQRWLEIAWEKGFDIAGANDFDQKIYGKKTWIGTTECAALFCSFGIRARIVDFSSASRLSTDVSGNKKRKSTPQVTTGPMDKYLNTTASTSTSNSKSINDNNFLGVKGSQLLANWVWSYFSKNNNNNDMSASIKPKPGCNRVVVTDKAPLYFQHDGHSRTIVGIQLKSLPNGMHQHSLLILDPAHKTKVLESCLSKKVGWQRYIKRGVHTLKKSDYQMCYMDHGIATEEEMEKLKILDSTRFEF